MCVRSLRISLTLTGQLFLFHRLAAGAESIQKALAPLRQAAGASGQRNIVIGQQRFEFHVLAAQRIERVGIQQTQRLLAILVVALVGVGNDFFQPALHRIVRRHAQRADQTTVGFRRRHRRAESFQDASDFSECDLQHPAYLSTVPLRTRH